MTVRWPVFVGTAALGLAAVGLVRCGGATPEPEPAERPPVEPIVEKAAPCVPPTRWAPPARSQASPLAAPAEPALQAAREEMAAFVAAHGRDPQNPWAVGHALLALGAEVTLTNEQPAVDFLFAEYGEKQAHGIGFPRKRGAIRIEPHTDLLLKAFTESGLTPDTGVKVGGQVATLGLLYSNSLCKAWVDGDQVSFDSWNDTPWALQGLAAWATDDLQWTAEGHAMTMDAFTHGVVAKLTAETAFMQEAMAAGTTVQKRKQGIFAYTCGGTHLVQGAAYAVGRGFGDSADREAMAQQATILAWRLPIELAAVDGALKSNPEYADLLLVQRLKFLGHFLETGHKLAILGLLPDGFDAASLTVARAELARTHAAMKAMALFERAPEIRKTHEQLYLDLIGDSAHAVRGIDLATGAGELRF